MFKVHPLVVNFSPFKENDKHADNGHDNPHHPEKETTGEPRYIF